MQTLFKSNNIKILKSSIYSMNVVRNFSSNQNIIHKLANKSGCLYSRPFSTLDKSENIHSISDLFDFTDEQKEFCDNVRELVEKEVEPQATDFNIRGKFNRQLFEKLGKNHLIGITIPEKFGGLGLEATEACILYEEMSFSDPAFTLSLLAHSILCAHNLYKNGNKRQHSKWLSDLCSGKKLGGIGMTEPNSGTDVLNMNTNYEVKGDDIILNGSKIYVTNAGVGDMFLVYGRDVNTMNDNSKRKNGISLFAVEKDMEGFTQHKMLNKHGMKSSPWGELSFHNVHIPKENIIGKLGEGLIPMMRNLELERITIASQSLGIIKRCLVEMIKYSKERKIGPNKLLYQSDETVRKITNAYTKYCSGGCKLYSCCRHLDLDHPGNRLMTDSTKLGLQKDAEEITLDAMHLFGASGNTSEIIAGRLHLDAYTLAIGAGTEEALRKNMMKDIFKYHSDLRTLF